MTFRASATSSIARGHGAGPHPDPVRSGFTLVEILIVVAILGILAAIAAPRFIDASEEAKRSAVLSQLHTIRSQIELYDFGNPDTPFNPLVPGGSQAWDQLVKGRLLLAAPTNPYQFNSTKVAVFPAIGTGWVWTDLGGGTRIYAVNEAGWYFDADGDGTPD